MTERFGAKKADIGQAALSHPDPGVTLTAQQPENNVVRVALQALAASAGRATQSLHTNSRDEALWLPTEESVQIALRTQQIIAYEAAWPIRLTRWRQYYVEHLTDQLENQARAYIQRIDDMGGAIAAIEAGYIQREIQESAYRQQRAVDAGQSVGGGMNRFTDDRKVNLKRLTVDPAIEREQSERLAALRARRG
jgi:methylmalonyl-CoA mutase N-terminal domain/subunit